MKDNKSLFEFSQKINLLNLDEQKQLKGGANPWLDGD